MTYLRPVHPILARRPWRLLLLVLALAAGAGARAQDGGQGGGQWVGTWSTAMQLPRFPPVSQGFPGRTLRQIVFTSIAGQRVRVRLSNAFGTAPVNVGAARIALHASGASNQPGSDRVLTFGGRAGVTLAPGASVLSDPVEFDVPARRALAVSIFFPGSTGAPTLHFRARQTNYVSPPGNFTAAASLPVESTGFCVMQGGKQVCSSPWYFLDGVEVLAPAGVSAIVALGDSITSGAGTPDNTNRRWPDLLARRLQNDGLVRGVLNQGIDGNTLWTSYLSENAQARFERDVLGAAGAKYVIVMLGINDLRSGVVPEHVIAALQQLATRARARGLRAYGGTLLPNANASDTVESARQAVNRWIRGSGAFDAVIDFDAALRDPAWPRRLRPAYDSGDALHPSPAGHEALANAIDLELFRP